MSTALELLTNELDTFVESNPDYFAYCDTFKQSALSQSVQELINFNTYNSQELKNYVTAILILKYRQEAPLGSAYAGLYHNLIQSLETVSQANKQVVKKFMADLYIAALCKEFSQIEKIEDFLGWMFAYDSLKQHNFDVKNLEAALSLNITTRVWNWIEEVEKYYNDGSLLRGIEALGELQKRNLELDSTVYSLFESIFRYLARKYNLHDLPDKPKEANLNEGKSIVGKLKFLRLEESQQALFEKLRQSIGTLIDNADLGPEVDFKRPDGIPPINIDFNSLIYQKTIYTNITNPNVHINIYHYKTIQGLDVALKIYEAQKSVGDLSASRLEIDILETLSTYSKPDNSFCKFYGQFFDHSKVYIAMEYHSRTLMQVISEYKNQGTKLPDHYIIRCTTSLLNDFNFLESLNIFHQDIKPHNILVTDDTWQLKIIDFSVSHMKNQDDASIMPTGINPIQGTKGYMAPELEENLKNNEKKGKFRRNKADVFSLGITLLQMYTLEDLYTLNLRENNGRLMEKVKIVSIEWLKTLLYNMLREDYHQRPSFKQCLGFLPKDDPTIKS